MTGLSHSPNILCLCDGWLCRGKVVIRRQAYVLQVIDYLGLGHADTRNGEPLSTEARFDRLCASFCESGASPMSAWCSGRSRGEKPLRCRHASRMHEPSSHSPTLESSHTFNNQVLLTCCVYSVDQDSDRSQNADFARPRLPFTFHFPPCVASFTVVAPFVCTFSLIDIPSVSAFSR